MEKANFKNRPTLGQPNLKIKKKMGFRLNLAKKNRLKTSGFSLFFGHKKSADFWIFGKKDNERKKKAPRLSYFWPAPLQRPKGKKKVRKIYLFFRPPMGPNPRQTTFYRNRNWKRLIFDRKNSTPNGGFGRGGSGVPEGRSLCRGKWGLPENKEQRILEGRDRGSQRRAEGANRGTERGCSPERYFDLIFRPHGRIWGTKSKGRSLRAKAPRRRSLQALGSVAVKLGG